MRTSRGHGKTAHHSLLASQTAADFAIAGDSHLAPGSNAIDFPTTVAIVTAPADVDGEARPRGVRADAGCDEAPPPP